jgi:hypothetical protein
MSTTVFSSGVMVPLNRKITEEEWAEWTDELCDQKSRVQFNYEGTLAYTDEVRYDGYDIRCGSMPTYESDSKFDDLNQYGLWVQEEKARPYHCMWYNGADSNMSTLTLEEFMKKTNQKID